MSAGSKEELQSLYFELGDALAQKGQLADAADSYALAMYYAKRGGNSALADLCREQILICHPNHVVIRENSAPLFYAQLLMRYPSDESKVQLERIKHELASKPAAPMTPAETLSMMEPMNQASSMVMADFEPAPSPVAAPSPPASPISPISASLPPTGMESPMSKPTTYPGSSSGVGTLDYPTQTSGMGRGGDLASLFGPATNTRAWSESISLPPAEPARASTKPMMGSVGHSGFEQHHAFSTGGMGPAAMASRIMDDFEMAPASGRIEETLPMPRPNGWGWLEPLAGAVALAGAVSAGFFAYKLWPELKRIDTHHLSARVDEKVQEAITWYKANFVDNAGVPGGLDDGEDASVEIAVTPSEVVAPAVPLIRKEAESTAPVVAMEPPAPPTLPKERPTVELVNQSDAPRALPPIPAGASSLPSVDSSSDSTPSRVAQQDLQLPPQ
ncbi:hypothetical protein K2Y11_05005 [bacterium]|nr:hypothetical protein [bacterium]